MQLKKLFIITAAALLSATPSKSTAQTWTWTKVLDYGPGSSTARGSIVADAAGGVFAGGSASGYGLVLQTTDLNENQNGWSLSDDSNPDQQEGSDWTFPRLAFDSNGELYSCGIVFNPCNQSYCPGYWYIRQRTATGWATVNTYPYPGGTSSAGEMAIAADDSGNIFVVGVAQDASGVHHWVVLKGSGTTWNTVEDIGGNGSGAGAIGIGFVPGVGVFALGWINTDTSGTHTWTVRMSPTGDPGTWVTVDQLQPSAGCLADPLGVCADGRGNIYVAGETTVLVGKQKTPTRQWIVRMSPAGPNAGNAGTWTTVDAYPSSVTAGEDSVASGVGRDLNGNVVVVGNAANLWFARSPTGRKGAWQTLNQNHDLDTGAYSSDAGAVVTDADGNLLVTGNAYFETGNSLVSHWIVRKGVLTP